MWRLNPFSGKESAGLEGRTIDISNIKITVKNAIAEGGFSCVYSARDSLNPSKQYALKHMICNDNETLDLVMREIQVMKLLKDHPNVVTLVSHTLTDAGRSKEALILMEFCDKSLVGVMESRGFNYFEERQILLIFRDVCNAVFAMHAQSPPIAHRDLKAENVLLGSDGVWKLCDFGSSSTNHKCFDRAEEMGIEEDIIRKHTTPAYRAPEMWDLYRREVISEKVDIWALGCLLYRLCYFKSAFDGESKLQILNGNYKIPEQPKYSASITALIKDLLSASPDARPDITQVWFRVNEQLPFDLQKNLPDGVASASVIRPNSYSFHDEGGPKRSPLIPRRSPPPPPSCSSNDQNTPASNISSRTGGDAPIGAFWSTQHAKDSRPVDSKNQNSNRLSPPDRRSSGPIAQTTVSNSNRLKELGEAVASLKEQLKRANLEKDEISSKYEKLSAICRAQRQEIQELKKQTLVNSNTQTHKIEGSAWEAFPDSNTKQSPNSTNYVQQNLPRNRNSSSNLNLADDTWGFGLDSLKTPPTTNRNVQNQPSGWAGF